MFLNKSNKTNYIKKSYESFIKNNYLNKFMKFLYANHS